MRNNLQKKEINNDKSQCFRSKLKAELLSWVYSARRERWVMVSEGVNTLQNKWQGNNSGWCNTFDIKT